MIKQALWTFNKSLHTFRVRNAIRWRTQRLVKYFRQFLLIERHTPLPLFIVGCQRSGTNMLVSVLDKSLETWVYNESHKKAFENYRIKSFTEREQLLRKANCKWVVFKALTDTHNIDRFLADHPYSKAIWIYRHYKDTTNSAIRKWEGGQLALIRLTATKPDWDYWLVERMSDEQRALVRQLYHSEMSYHSAAALKWYLRNSFFFTYHLDEHAERVRLVQYEALVSSPAYEFECVFWFLGLQFRPEYVSDVYTSSVNRDSFRPIDPEVQELCEELQNRLDRIYRSQVTL